MTLRRLGTALAAAAVTSLLLLGCASSGSTSAVPSTSSATTTESPAPSDSTSSLVKPVTYQGNGATLLTIEKPSTGTMLITTTITGSGPSAVHAMNYDGSVGDLLARAVGDYHGTTILDGHGGIDTQHLKVDVPGTWQITLSELSTVKQITGSATGSQDDVLMFTGPAPVVMTFSNRGTGAVTVRMISAMDTSFVVTGAGTFTKKAPITSDYVILQVTTNGTWSMAFAPA